MLGSYFDFDATIDDNSKKTGIVDAWDNRMIYRYNSLDEEGNWVVEDENWLLGYYEETDFPIYLSLDARRYYPGTYRYEFMAGDKAGNITHCYSEPFHFKSNKEFIKEKIDENKEQNGKIDYTKLKEDLDSKKSVIKLIPETITDSDFPLVLRVDEKLIEISKDGTIQDVTKVDLFPLLAQKGLEPSNVSKSITFSGCQNTLFENGDIGGNCIDGRGEFEWYWTIKKADCIKWFPIGSKIKLKATFWIHEGYGESYASVKVFKKNKPTEIVETDIIQGDEVNKTLEVIIDVSDMTSIRFYGHGVDLLSGSSHVFLNKVVFETVE